MDRIKPAISVTALGALLGASMLVFGPAGTLMAQSSKHIAHPRWLVPVAIGIAVDDALLLVYVFVLRSKINGRFGERFRQRGKDPAEFVGIIGLAPFSFPATAALVLSLFGLPLTWLWAVSVTSAIATMIWAFTYRPRPASTS